jgi:hypothetical protein
LTLRKGRRCTIIIIVVDSDAQALVLRSRNAL